MENLLDYIRKTDLYRKFKVDDLLFTEFKCPPDESKSGIWWHSNFFAYILAGESLLKTPRHEYVLKPGQCVFARKGSVITMSQTEEDFCELLIFVTDDFIKSVIHKYEIPISEASVRDTPDTVIPLATDEVLLGYFQSLLSYFSMPEPPAETLLKLKFEELIVHIVSHKSHHPLKSYFGEICARAKPSIRGIMENNFTSNLSLIEFARLCGRSLSTFKREFIELYQTTPGKWLKVKRLEHSRFLLETTGLSIGEVCFECGFENRSHFIHVFRNHYGITPGQLHSGTPVIDKQ